MSGTSCTMCPSGPYQNSSRQPTCLQYPVGLTTTTLADPRGAHPARAPPKGPNPFVSTYKICKMSPHRESVAPLTRLAPPHSANPGSATAQAEQAHLQLIVLVSDILGVFVKHICGPHGPIFQQW